MYEILLMHSKLRSNDTIGHFFLHKQNTVLKLCLNGIFSLYSRLICMKVIQTFLSQAIDIRMIVPTFYMKVCFEQKL